MFRSTATTRTVIHNSRITQRRKEIAASTQFFSGLLDNKSLEAQWGIAEINRRIGAAENSQAALEQYQSILAQDPKNLPALDSLIQLDIGLARWGEAADLQKQLIATRSHSDAGDYEQLGALLVRAGHQEEGQQMLMQCLDLDPYNFKAHLDLGFLFSRERLWTEAQRHLEFVRQYDPGLRPDTYILLDQAYTALGHRDAASEAVRFGLRLFPDNAELRRLSNSQR